MQDEPRNGNRPIPLDRAQQGIRVNAVAFCHVAANQDILGGKDDDGALVGIIGHRAPLQIGADIE